MGTLRTTVGPWTASGPRTTVEPRTHKWTPDHQMYTEVQMTQEFTVEHRTKDGTRTTGGPRTHSGIPDFRTPDRQVNLGSIGGPRLKADPRLQVNLTSKVNSGVHLDPGPTVGTRTTSGHQDTGVTLTNKWTTVHTCTPDSQMDRVRVDPGILKDPGSI